MEQSARCSCANGVLCGENGVLPLRKRGAATMQMGCHVLQKLGAMWCENRVQCSAKTGYGTVHCSMKMGHGTVWKQVTAQCKKPGTMWKHSKNGAMLTPVWQNQGSASKCHTGASTAPFVSHVLTAPFVCMCAWMRKMLPSSFSSSPLIEKDWRPLL